MWDGCGMDVGWMWDQCGNEINLGRTFYYPANVGKENPFYVINNDKIIVIEKYIVYISHSFTVVNCTVCSIKVTQTKFYNISIYFKTQSSVVADKTLEYRHQ